MRKVLAVAGLALAALGGCTWLVPQQPELFPAEILPGWRLDVEATLVGEDLPPGASGGRAATWRAGGAWLWAEVLTMGTEADARGLFSQTVATFREFQESGIENEGVVLVHGPSGLVLHFFRVGTSLVLVGSLGASAEEAPSADLVRRAAQNLAGRVPHAVVGSIRQGGTSEPPLRASSAPAVEIQLELREPGGRVAGTLTLRVYGVLVGEQGGICSYRLAFHLGRVRLHDVPEDGPFRGPLDLFLAGRVVLPCGPLTFITEELAHLRPGEERVFDEPGLVLGELDCAVPCVRPDIPLNLNVVLRNNDSDDLLDLLHATILALLRAEPQATLQWEVVEDLRRAYGPPVGNPLDPIRTAEGVRGTTVGGAEDEFPLPTEIYGIRLEFSATLAIAGSCSRPAPNVIHCQVPEGATGTLTLTAKRTPVGAVNIRAVSLPPGWPVFPAASGWGTLRAVYPFTVPPGTAGRQFELRFRAWAAGVMVDLEVRVILDVVPAEGIGAGRVSGETV